MRQAFTLVELSIVLVIIGLLVGGVLSGQTLIRASELRAVAAEYNSYTAATMAFRDKYFGIPGDLNTATRYWGRGVVSGDCVTNSSAAVATPGTCDGDGSGRLSVAPGAAQSGEIFQFWRHLALAGLVAGNYTGYAGALSPAHTVLGTNAPASKLSGAGWLPYSMATFYAGDPASFAADYQNYYYYGAASSNWVPWGLVLKPEDAFNLDTKIDDGKPGTGRIIVNGRDTCTNSASATDYASNYLVSVTTVACGLFFIKAF